MASGAAPNIIDSRRKESFKFQRLFDQPQRPGGVQSAPVGKLLSGQSGQRIADNVDGRDRRVRIINPGRQGANCDFDQLIEPEPEILTE